MKAILYFTPSGFVRDSDRSAAQTIHEKTGKAVAFRNAKAAAGERPEANEGVAGDVPPNYQNLFDRYGDAGTVVSKGELPPVATEAATLKLNEIGVPEGGPTDREGLKQALLEAKVKHHPNAALESLVKLYLEHYHPDKRSEGTGSTEPKDD